VSLVQSIKVGFPHAVRARCKERGCELRLRGLKSHVVLRGETLCPDRRMPDCIVFVQGTPAVIAVAELKSRTIDADEIAEKLRNGSEAALRIFEARSQSRGAPSLYHLVLCKGCPTSERKAIRDRRLLIGGRKYDIIVKRCGVSLSTAVAALR